MQYPLNTFSASGKQSTTLGDCFFFTLFNFNLFQSTFDIKTGVKNVYFELLHYFLYMSLHGFVIPRWGYFIKFELFSSPKGRKIDQKIAKNSNAAPLPVPLLRLER